MFKLNSMFTDNMVLQRESKVPIWGTAIDGEKVQVEFCSQKQETICVNGKWNIILDVLNAGGPFDMKVICGSYEMVLKNILIGDVFIAAGQSNMEYKLKDSMYGKEEIEHSYSENIRYYSVPQIEYEDENKRIPNFEEGKWETCSPESSENFSAVAHYFAKNLYKYVNVPIGIISCNKGGTSASCWIDERYLLRDESIKKAYLDDYLDAVKDMTEEEEDKRNSEYLKVVQKYNCKLEKYKKDNPHKSMSEVKKAVGHTPWPPPFGKKSYLRPSGLYSTMFRKVVPYKVKAVLWYQGEEDTQNCTLYKKLFNCLIENWREDFKNPKLKFVFVQLPYYYDDKEEKPKNSWAILRDNQLSVMRNTENTDMIVTIDCGEKFNIHPVNKKPIGERLALMVRNRIYKENINGYSPIYKSMEIEAGRIIIYFDFTRDDSLVIKGGDELKGFEISGEDNKFVYAKAYIDGGNKVIVYNKNIKNPKKVRYGWKNYDEVNLYNKSGLPASPFRTDFKY
ncbi:MULTISPECIES: sialate O-acetylesterase [Clostridium]|uniref:sialate O-acetylesterase n=1 Tax=Clostridium TaxID=1485 RepID=UPI0008251C8C|nr:MULTISPECIES: sialate O-acetylesterase [Clostridium]